jgi:hypothetical protein
MANFLMASLPLSEDTRLETVQLIHRLYDLHWLEPEQVFVLCEHGTRQPGAGMAAVFWDRLTDQSSQGGFAVALGILVDRDLGRVTYQVCLRRETGLFGFEWEQLAELLQQHAQLGHVVLETRVTMPTDGALPYLAVTVNRLLPEDASWLQHRDERMGQSPGMSGDELHDSRTINETGAIARRVAALSSQERDALDEAVTA